MGKIAQAIRKGIQTRKFIYSKKSSSAYHWTYVLRAEQVEKRHRIALGMLLAVKCKKIRYSNSTEGRSKLYDAVKPYRFNCMKLKKKTTTNCCNLVSVACRYAGIKTPKRSNSRTLPKEWKKYGFKVYRYKHGKTKLKRGDILVSTTMPCVHTAVYLG